MLVDRKVIYGIYCSCHFMIRLHIVEARKGDGVMNEAVRTSETSDYFKQTSEAISQKAVRYIITAVRT
jgi:hypothetical protein